MTGDEVWDLLGKIASCDLRVLGKTDGELWESLVGDLDYDDAVAAVAAHYRESTERIMAAHIRRRVAAIRASRVERAGPLHVDNEELADDPVAYRRALAEAGHRAAGNPARQMIGGGA